MQRHRGVERCTRYQDIHLASLGFGRNTSESQKAILGLCLAVVLGNHFPVASFQGGDYGQVERLPLPIAHLKYREQ